MSKSQLSRVAAQAGVSDELEKLRAEIEKLRAELAEVRSALEKAIDSECDKILAMTDEQVSALAAMDGRNPDDVAQLGKMAVNAALLTVRAERAEAEVEALRKAAIAFRDELLLVGRLSQPAWDAFNAAIDAAQKESK